MYNEKVTIIAEVGTNHNGDLKTALEMIELAASAGADIVKFQSFSVDTLASATDPNFQRLKKLELPLDWYAILKEHCAEHHVKFMSTATNFQTMHLMEELDICAYKVASCNATYWPMLKYLAQINKPIYLSLGLTSLDELMAINQLFENSSVKDYTFLHCVPKYPTPIKDSHLGNIKTLQALVGNRVGYSDHTHSLVLPAAAVALGARVIEKHVSMDKTGIGMDHDVAVTLDEFKQVCSSIREVEDSLQTSFEVDRQIKLNMCRSMRVARDLPKGTVLKEEDIKISRPNDGLSSMYYDSVVGSTLKQDMKKEQPILRTIVQEN